MQHTRSALRHLVMLSAGVVAGVIGPIAGAQTVTWTDWTSVTQGTPGSASGTITIGGQTVNVQYSGEVRAPSQTSSASYNYWRPASTFTSATVTDAPTNTGIITLEGGNDITNTLTFSSSLQNVFMAIMSLGQGGRPTTYHFNTPFTLLSQGPSSTYGGCNTCLTQPSGSVLSGTEGDGTIEFNGPISSISWTAPTPEYWHGFTVGADAFAGSVGTVPEPSSLALLGTGVVGLIPMLRRRKRI